jgi:hypothetical protein
VVQVRAPGTGVAGARPRTGWGDDLVTVLLAAWTVVGLFLDGWAHGNLAELETFLTPWHAVLYSGFAATAAWIAGLVRRHRLPGRSWREAVPNGYGLGVAGVVVFLAGGLGDWAWHGVFGVERDLAALLSPTHLLLLLGGLLMVTSPLRSAWSSPAPPAPGLRGILPGLLSVTLATSAVAFFFHYLSLFLTTTPAIRASEVLAVWRRQAPAVPGDLLEHHVALQRIHGIASLLVTALTLVAPVLLLLRRWRLPFGSVALLFATVGGLVGAFNQYDSWELSAAAAAAGVLADLLIARLRPSPERPGAFRATAALVPTAVLGLYFLAVQAVHGIGWDAELWTGVIAFGALGGYALGLLMLPPAIPAGQDR